MLLYSITKENCALIWLFSDSKEYLSLVNRLKNESKKIIPQSFSEGRESFTLFGSKRFTAYQTVQFSIVVVRDSIVNRIDNTQGLIIGIATDNQSRKTWLVEFLINGQSLGIAFDNLPRIVAFRPAASVAYSASINFLEFV
ncbi:hypothetical protein ABK040_001603 [Willaertia magna]